jgi:hypothetical protein
LNHRERREHKEKPALQRSNACQVETLEFTSLRSLRSLWFANCRFQDKDTGIVFGYRDEALLPAYHFDRHGQPTLPVFAADGSSEKKQFSHEKAQKSQKKESFALTETFTEWVTAVSTPSFSFCVFFAFSWPTTAVFRFIKQHVQATNASASIHDLRVIRGLLQAPFPG